MSNLVGKIIGHYRLDALVGDGGMGTVYRAYDTNLERTVALKLMHAHYARQPEFQARLTQEAKTAAQLDHPSIVRIFDFGESDEGLFIAMEYISGGNLRSHLRRLQERRLLLPLKQSLQIGFQMAEALDYAHRQGVIHRDMKPGNIILKPLNRPDEPGEQPFRAILTDFGLVKLLEGDALTHAGTTLGTPTYMSPEQCEGLTLDGRTDLYSLGVVLYELVSNQLPFQFKSLSEAMATHMRGELPHPPRSIRPELPRVIDSILTKLLAKAPSDRFESGRALADALRSAMIAVDEAPTQVMLGGGPPPQENAADDPPQGFQLEIKTPGRESSFAALSRPTITIGRNVDNDIVLPANGVSRYHTRMQVSQGGWAVVDLGGVNGTWLGDIKLESDVSYPLKPGDNLQIGPYQLKLEGPLLEEPPTVPQPQSTELPTNVRQTVPYEGPLAEDPSEGPVELFLARDTLTVEPGRREEIKVEVLNRSEKDDRVNLRVFGVPSEWVEVPDTFVDVPAGGSTTIPIVFQPPRKAGTPAGRQRVRIELNSQQFRRVRSAVSVNMMLGVFEDFVVEMTPRNVKLPAVVTVTLHNTGNAPAEYSLVGRESSSHIQFRGERGRIQLLPDQVATVDLQLESRSTSWLGSNETYAFEVEVASRSGARHSVSGNADGASVIPLSLGYAALFVVVFLCALSSLLLVFRGGFGPGGLGNSPTITTNAITFGTATSVSATQTAVASITAGAGTLLAGTAAFQGDVDSDGLSDAQEALIGTDPQNPDTDGDGLLDGQEVLTLTTSPTKSDTDGDTLSDGAEVLTYHTNPKNPDTDGDTLSDGAEVAAGTNPLNPADGPVSPTPTAPTLTPSTTPTIDINSLPDLVVPFEPSITFESTGCLVPGTSLGTRVTIRNLGTVAAGSFIVSINGTQRTVTGLEPGNVVSIWVPGNINPTIVVVDVTNTVNEGNELNNTFNGSVPVPTPPVSCTNTPTVTGVPPTITPTWTPTPTGLPSPTLTGSPTITPTPSYTPTPTPTGTVTETPSPTPTITVAPVVNPLVNCAANTPTLDGVMQANEWGLLPMVEFGPNGAPENNVTAYFLKNSTNYYLAFLIGDTTLNPATDSIRIYFDVTNNAGDPDSTDRFFQISREGTLTIQSGTDNNVDGQDWDSNYASNNGEVVVGEPGGNSWLVEMQVEAAEMPLLLDGNPFGMTVTVLYTGLIYTWPAGAITDNAATWQVIDNQVC